MSGKRTRPTLAATYTPPPPKLGVWETQDGSHVIRFNGLRIHVHHHIDHAPDVWLLTTYPTLFERRALESKDIDEAKDEALCIVGNKLERLARAIDEVRR